MEKCIVCGRENAGLLCPECRDGADVDALCTRVRLYRPGSGEDPLWEQIAGSLEQPWKFRELAMQLAEVLPPARRAYQQILATAGNSRLVNKADRPWLYETAPACLAGALSPAERCRILGLLLSARANDHCYFEAEELAQMIEVLPEHPWQADFVLGEFYCDTRRYDLALVTFDRIKGSAPVIADALDKQRAVCNARKLGKAAGGKQPYLPKEAKDREAYLNFLASIGIKAELPAAKQKKIAAADCPPIRERRTANFHSFVAFDVETTGLNPARDSIIEIGAVKVVDGVVTCETFQEFVHPKWTKVSQEVTEITGITAEDVAQARRMEDVIPEFLHFAGDSILVGYNSMFFDARFLERAGRYCGRVIPNEHFDVMRQLGKDPRRYQLSSRKLSAAAEAFGIQNPQAHRALADAITTARLYLALLGIAEE